MFVRIDLVHSFRPANGLLQDRVPWGAHKHQKVNSGGSHKCISGIYTYALAHILVGSNCKIDIFNNRSVMFAVWLRLARSNC